jgi:radical SAM superfamily enzyme YgiQ (UPF0313 family)
MVRRLLPNTMIIVGGIHPTLLPERTLKDMEADLLVIGEGKLTFRELISCLKEDRSFQKIPGIAYRLNGEIIINPLRPLIDNLDLLPFPARDLIFNPEDFSINYGMIFTARGCPSKCIFCASNKLWSRKVRFRSKENILEELKAVIKTHSISYFRFTDDTFTLNKKRTLDLCQLIIDEKLNIAWECDTKVKCLDEELLEKMKEAGCIQVNIGVESGSERIRRLIRKECSIEKIEKAFRLINEVGIEAVAYFMFGFPSETKEDMEKTLV